MTNSLKLKDFQSDYSKLVVRGPSIQDFDKEIDRLITTYYSHIKEECLTWFQNQIP